jgi:hypothetical protein
MKKKLLVSLLVLSISSIASASYLITIDGVVDPVGFIMMPSNTDTLGIVGVGNPNPGDARAFWLLVQGPGVTSGGTDLYGGGALDEVRTQTSAQWDAEFELPNAFASFGFPGVTTATSIVLASTTVPVPPLNGNLVGSINFHCEGLDTVTLTLVSDNFATVYDTQTLYMIPEPATIALLCLGCLMLRRRK